uniref:phage portal protein n=1 Tax=uncultured Sphingomonas sp. TaxID=158754 RepID=UPI0035CC8CC1
MSGYRLSPRAAAAEERYDAARAVETKGYPAITYPGFQPGQQDGDNFRTNMMTTVSMERVNDTGAAVQQAAVGLTATWGCVNFWAGNIASLPLTVMRPGPGGVAVEDTSHPLYWLLHDSPNYDQSAYDFWEFAVAGIELTGNAYAEITRRENGFITALTPVRPDIVRVTRNSFGVLIYRWTDSTGDHVVDQTQMLHIRGFGGNPLGGVSPLTACRLAFASALTTDRAASTVFANGVRPSGVLSTDKALTKDQRDLLEQLLQEKFVGAVNAGRPMLLDNAVKWEQLSIDPSDAQMLESRRFGVEEVCRVFEVDPHLVGQTVGNTTLGSSIDSQTLSVMKFKMRKRLKRIEGALAKQLLTVAEVKSGVSIKFNVDAFLRADSVGRSAFYASALQNGYMTINEVRALEGLPPVPGGNVPRMQMQNVPITDAGQTVDGVTP